MESRKILFVVWAFPPPTSTRFVTGLTFNSVLTCYDEFLDYTALKKKNFISVAFILFYLQHGYRLYGRGQSQYFLQKCSELKLSLTLEIRKF